jgi:hypothetical protein
MGATARAPTTYSPSGSPGNRSGSGTRGSSPSGPSTASPSGPSPAGLGPITPSTRPHGATTQSLLRIQWDYPVYAGGPSTSDGALSARKGALPAEEALRFVAGDDPRPLLVVRECAVCNRTDRALLSPGVDNERTILLSRWFHCVKLPVDVRAHEHALHALFPRDDAEHLFVSAADGSGRVALEAATSRTQLWAAMSATLARAYAVDPAPACRQLATLVENFDLLDQKLVALQMQKSRGMESGKLDAAELRKLDEAIEALRGQLARELERAESLPKADLRGKSVKAGE